MLEIRSATEDDYNQLIALYINEVEDNKQHAKSFAEGLLTRFKTILAVQDGTLCGTISWDRRGGYEDGVVELIGLGVNREYQRQGIATKLVDAMIEEVSELFVSKGYVLRVIILFMEYMNEGARGFYSAIGFSEVAKIPKLYPHDDCMIWTRYF